MVNVTNKRIVTLFTVILLLVNCRYSMAAVQQSNNHQLHMTGLSPFNQTLQIKALVPPISPSESIWPQLREEFQLIQQYNQRSAVKNAIQWFLHNKGLLNQVLENANPYLYYISQQIKQQHLPGELALLPMVESGYNPFAYSNRTATGLWQIMPTTALYLGLKINWWYDARRDTVVSTEYALRYLEQLHNRFHDWLLALAAYDLGQGRIEQAIQYNKSVGKKTDFWSLSLPSETKNYIPKLLALAQIIDHPSLYGISLPTIANKPYFAIIPIKSQITLTEAANLANVDEDTIQQLNPGLRRWATSPNTTYHLLVPASHAKAFEERVKKLAGKEQITWIYHDVRSGETLHNIARNYYTSSQVLRKANGLTTHDTIAIGQGILVPVRLHQTFDTSIKPIKITDVELPSEETTQRMHETRMHNTNQSNLGQKIRKDDTLKTIVDKLYSSATRDHSKN